MGVSKNECISFIFRHSRARSALKRRLFSGEGGRLFVRAGAHEGEEVRSSKYFWEQGFLFDELAHQYNLSAMSLLEENRQNGRGVPTRNLAVLRRT